MKTTKEKSRKEYPRMALKLSNDRASIDELLADGPLVSEPDGYLSAVSRTPVTGMDRDRR